ncbi:hypothetical protein EDC01DRAFT_651774 [Geopyxis carbonaria]|nr:hypothetical protein EDC01DRAFT_651774 [Geopyxis carbonaria]
MPGLNPLQNAQPKQRIPNEAPQYFNTFFEQPAKPPPVTIWQPPHIEKPPRSKAPTQRRRTPPTIPTAGTWSRKSSRGEEDKEKEPKGLFQPKLKRSVDEMMWLGSVTGFELKEEKSLRSKLVRKPEEIPSQASALTGPKATEDKKKKEDEEKARQQRLQAWSKKKPQATTEKTQRNSDLAASPIIPLPQPIESRLRPKKKIYTPVPQASEVARISNRPNAIHRPFMPTHDDGGYAPENTFLPQPIETVRKSNRPRLEKVASKAEEDEGTLWMGLPQPIETVRKSNRKSRLNKVSSIDDNDTKTEEKPSILPEPIETTRRSNRPAKPQTPISILPQPVESTRRSNRPVKQEILPEPIETVRRSNRPQKEILPEPIETVRRSNRPKKEILPEPIETTRRSNRPADKSDKTQQAEESSESTATNKESGRPDPSPIQRPSPPTPTTSFFGPDTLPQPIESSRRSHRPVARPLVPQVVETSMRSNRIRVPASELHLELPQPVSVSRWSNRSAGPSREPRRESSQPMSPGLYAPPLHRDRSRRKPQQDMSPAADHVWHLHEPVDSVPPSPAGSPDASPSASKCPSLSSSPTSSAASSAWGGPVKKRAIPRRRESLEHGFSGYVLELERTLKKEGACGTDARLNERSKEEEEYPFPIVDEIHLKADDGVGQRLGRSESSETIRPAPRAIGSEPNIKIDQEPRLDQDMDDYPICHSPVFSNFKRPQLPITPDDAEDKPQDNNSDIPTFELDIEMTKSSSGLAVPTAPSLFQLPTPPNSHSSKAIPNSGAMTAPPRMWYRPTGPSPGYTVASLPPTKRKAQSTVKEVTPEFVEEVYRYLSLQFDNIALKFDDELASYTGLTTAEVRADRKLAVGKYCQRWVQENPEIAAGEGRKGGLW